MEGAWVDVVFGTYNIGLLPALLDRARHNRQRRSRSPKLLREFLSDLPASCDSAYAGMGFHLRRLQ